MFLSNMISFLDMLSFIDEVDEYGKPKVFSMKYVTCGRTRGEGGNIVTVDACRKSIVRKKKKQGFIEKLKSAATGSHKSEKRVHMNYVVCGTHNVRAVALRLIIEFNGHQVFH